MVGSNVMHYVATKPVSILDIISAGDKYSNTTMVTLLNTRNTENMTPLHIACDQDKPDMVRAMLRSQTPVSVKIQTKAESWKNLSKSISILFIMLM